MKTLNLNQRIFGRLKQSLARIAPAPPLAGLEINDSLLRLVEFQKGEPREAAFRLPPGVIEKGEVKNKETLKLILGELYSRLSPDRGRAPGIILTIPSNNVFIQTITLPPVARENFEEAARLNLEMASPLNPKGSYADWQRLEGTKGSGAPTELLGTFVPKRVVDGFLECLREVGFEVVAVEFTSLSLVRELKRQKLIEPNQAYLAVEIKTEGMAFILIQDNQLIFHSFSHWKTIQGEGRLVLVEEFLNTLVNEINNISNFYATHWGSSLNKFIFITPAFQDEIRETLKKGIVLPADKEAVVFINPQAVKSAVGAASRSFSVKDGREITLLGISALKIFEQNRSLVFVTLWRSAFAVILGFLLLVFLGSDLSLRQLALKTEATNTLRLEGPEARELLELEKEAQRFNQLLATVRENQSEVSRLGPIIDRVNQVAGSSIEINRLYIPSLDGIVTISGVALNEQAAVEFKKRLATEGGFTEVELPLSGLMPETRGRVSFTLHFKVQSLDLPPETLKVGNKLESEEEKESETQKEEPKEVQAEEKTEKGTSSLSQGLVEVTEALKSAKPVAKGPLIIFGKIYFKSIAEPITLEVSALDEETANLFVNKLEESPNFYNVKIISGFTKTEDNRTKFLLSFFATL